MPSIFNKSRNRSVQVKIYPHTRTVFAEALNSGASKSALVTLLKLLSKYMYFEIDCDHHHQQTKNLYG